MLITASESFGEEEERWRHIAHKGILSCAVAFSSFPHVALKLAPVFRGYAEVNQSNEGKTMEVMTLTSLASEVEKGGLFLSNLGGESRVFYFSVYLLKSGSRKSKNSKKT